NSLVERVYQLDKQKGFDGAGTPEGKQFTEERLAAGASMLRGMITPPGCKAYLYRTTVPRPRLPVIPQSPPSDSERFGSNSLRCRSFFSAGSAARIRRVN